MSSRVVVFWLWFGLGRGGMRCIAMPLTHQQDQSDTLIMSIGSIGYKMSPLLLNLAVHSLSCVCDCVCAFDFGILPALLNNMGV